MIHKEQFCNKERIISEFKKFLNLYNDRPIKFNHGGMKINHMFWLYYVLKTIKPSCVIESGGGSGQSSWMIRNCLKETTIFSFDPLPKPVYVDEAINYFYGDRFVDFSLVNWDKYKIDKKETFILFDDHQSAFKRILQMDKLGFKHACFDDNMPYGGDNYNIKTLFKDFKKDEKVFFMDNFGNVKKEISIEKHFANRRVFENLVRFYHEFEPILKQNKYGQMRDRIEGKFLFDRYTKEQWDNMCKPPLFKSIKEINETCININQDLAPEFDFYCFFTYVNLV